MKLYTTRIDCEVAGTWRPAGVPFSLTDGQAAELLPPRGNVVALYAPPLRVARETRPAVAKETTDYGRLGRNKRRNRQASD